MHRKLCAIALAVGAACAAPAFAEVVEVYTIPTGQDYYYVTPSYTTTDAVRSPRVPLGALGTCATLRTSPRA